MEWNKRDTQTQAGTAAGKTLPQWKASQCLRKVNRALGCLSVPIRPQPLPRGTQQL